MNDKLLTREEIGGVRRDLLEVQRCGRGRPCKPCETILAGADIALGKCISEHKQKEKLKVMLETIVHAAEKGWTAVLNESCIEARKLLREQGHE